MAGKDTVSLKIMHIFIVAECLEFGNEIRNRAKWNLMSNWLADQSEFRNMM